jgi:integrase
LILGRDVKQYVLPLDEPATDKGVELSGLPRPITLAVFASQFLLLYAGPPWHPAKNVRHARNVLNAYILPELGDLQLDAIEPRHLRAVQRKMLARGLSVNTVKGAIQSVFGSVWKAAKADGLVSGSPQSELTWPRSTPSPDPFSADERDQIVVWFQRRQPQYLALAGSVFLAGMRPSEACGLRWGDIDLDTGEVTIARPIASREQTKGKTSKSLRQIRVSDRLRGLYRMAKPSWAEGSGLVSLNRYRREVDSSQFGRMNFHRCCAELGLRYRGFYHGRHTFISLSLQDGANPAEVSAFCAVSLGTMQRHYWQWMGSIGDPVSEATRRANARLDRDKRGGDSHRAKA